MNARCNSPTSTSYPRYGGIGISICKRWTKFENFVEDMGERPSTNYQIDRIDNTKGHTPDNCKWSTPKEQSLNRRSNLLVTYRGETKPLVVWAEELNLSYNAMHLRLTRYKMDVEKAFNKPLRRKLT